MRSYPVYGMGGHGAPAESEYNQHLRATPTYAHPPYTHIRDSYPISSDVSHTPPSENASEGGLAESEIAVSKDTSIAVNGEKGMC